MGFTITKASVFVITFLLIFTTFFFSNGVSQFEHSHTTLMEGGGGEEDGSLVLSSWRRSVVEGLETSNNKSLMLAAERTRRKDPLNGFKYYTGGWNISEKHYWASVGFTAVPFFVIGLAWFAIFGLCLLLICCCYCCFPHRSYSYSRTAYALSLIFLILFTCAAIIGCVVLYEGQGKFHGITSDTLDYVVSQANFTVDNLKNFSSNLAAAKRVGVDNIFLPSVVQANIDGIQTKLNASANDLSTRTEENSKNIHNVLDSVRLVLIIIAAVMLFLAFLGFLFSVLGLQFLVYILVLFGWFLVGGTFILCGVFLLFHNVVGDTCVAMDEWVLHPHAHTSLDDILPCVDTATANESFYQSKQVTFQLVNVVNGVITNISNQNFPPRARPPLYYNQSGPLVPILCNPFASDMTNRECMTGEVDLKNATQVWRSFLCNVSANGICTTVGRLTPSLYAQMTSAVDISYALYRYGPFLAQLQNCTFVRDTFGTISRSDCPNLQKYSKWVYTGLVLVSTAIMLSLIFWVVYARERRHRKFNKKSSDIGHQQPPYNTVQNKTH